MRLLTRHQLRTQVWAALTDLKLFQKRALGVLVEQTRGEVTDDLVHRIMGEPESETVILQPDLADAPIPASASRTSTSPIHTPIR